jgi:hypothetical protein
MQRRGSRESGSSRTGCGGACLVVLVAAVAEVEARDVHASAQQLLKQRHRARLRRRRGVSATQMQKGLQAL